nr:MAG TPA: hypothetical protein [Caudoviricetes sp.]
MLLLILKLIRCAWKIFLFYKRMDNSAFQKYIISFVRSGGGYECI